MFIHRNKKRKRKTSFASYLKHLCPADRAYALRGRLAVFHCDFFLILHRPFGFTFDAICLCCHGPLYWRGGNKVSSCDGYYFGTRQVKKGFSFSVLSLTL